MEIGFKKGRVIMNVTDLKKELEEGKVRGVYLFYGEEEFLIDKYLKSLEEKVLDSASKQMNLDILEDVKSANKIIDACKNYPVFSDKRLIVVKRSNFFARKKKTVDEQKEKEKAADSKEKKEFENLLENVPEHVCLVFIEESAVKSMRSVKALEKKGAVVEFSYQKPEDIGRWIRGRLKEESLMIEPRDLNLLVEYCDKGLTHVNSQLEKLILYCQGKEKIDRDAIVNLCNPTIKSIIFDLTDAIAQRDVRKAYKHFNDMIELREPMPKIYFMITKQFRQILNTKLLLQKGFDKAKVIDVLKVHPYVAQKLCAHARNFDVDALKSALKDSYEMDVLNKMSLLDAKLSAEILIAQFANSGVK